MDYRNFLRYRKVIILEVLSFMFGVVGFFIGALSVIVLFLSTAYNTQMSNILTYEWILVDGVSIFFGCYAVIYSYRTRSKDIDENYKVKKAAKKASYFDIASIVNGLVGEAFATISVIYMWDLNINIAASILTLVFDFLSVMFVVFSFDYLLTELWNSFNFILKKTKTIEIQKARKILTKKIRQQVEEEVKQNIEGEIEGKLEDDFDSKKRRQIEKELKKNLERQLRIKLTYDLTHEIEARLRPKITKELEEKYKGEAINKKIKKTKPVKTKSKKIHSKIDF
ncbi:hypothetical protein [Spiroplasma endosymbiont of Aspidapion aeneum]|uniref:hypothetical protein n=1 Tax=Spiroplasma endosymbiont of Aspidapion aeneum TaxID=3066276 RepID=UPI00313B45DD